MNHYLYYIVFLLSSICSLQVATAQESISGHWEGRLYQDAGGLASDYFFEMDLKQVGATVTGTSHIDLNGKADGTMQAIGRLNGSVFTYKESRILSQTGIVDTNAWCLKTCRLLLSRVADTLYLKGTWTGFTRKFGVCSPGTIRLSKYSPLTPPSEETVPPTVSTSSVTIKMVDRNTGAILKEATLYMGKKGKTKTKAKEVMAGIWAGQLLPATYIINAQSSGYYAFDSTFVVEKGASSAIVCPMSPIHTGDVFKMENLYFEQSKAIITSESEEELQQLVDFMRTNKRVRILIAGHTDNVGSSYANKVLSINRTKAVKNYLEQHGIEAARMEYKGYGEERPVASNTTAEGQAKNRRVEIEILSIR